jgi:hypothetical protein
VQSEFELAGYLEVAVETSDISTLVANHLGTDEPITVRNIGTQIISHINNKIVLKNDL